MDKFWELLKSSVLVQGMIALSTLSVILYLYASGQDVPNALTSIFMIILGYYFGAKAQQIINTQGK